MFNNPFCTERTEIDEGERLWSYIIQHILIFDIKVYLFSLIFEVEFFGQLFPRSFLRTRAFRLLIEPEVMYATNRFNG